MERNAILMSKQPELPEIEVSGHLTTVPTDAELDEASKKLGIELPPSYRAFAKKYGFGLTYGLFYIYVPVNNSEAGGHLVDRSEELKEEINESIEGGYMRFTPGGSKEIAERAVPFGYSDNGHILFWDPNAKNSRGEYPIYVVWNRKSGVFLAADDFYEFLQKASEPGVGGILGRATFQLRQTFEPLK